MENLLWLIPVLACPIGMGVMMFFMGKGMGRKRDEAPAPARAPEAGEPSRPPPEVISLNARDGARAEPGVEREPAPNRD